MSYYIIWHPSRAKLIYYKRTHNLIQLSLIKLDSGYLLYPFQNVLRPPLAKLTTSKYISYVHSKTDILCHSSAKFFNSHTLETIINNKFHPPHANQNQIPNRPNLTTQPTNLYLQRKSY